ncbi:MAG: glycosyltransferase family 4 protein [Nanoarchaeota archaeon]
MKHKLLWVSDSPNLITGYATVTKNILNRLNNYPKWDCTALASTPSGAVGEPIKRIELMDGTNLNFKILSAYREPYAMDIVTKYIKNYNFNVLGILLDTFMLYPKFLQVDIPCKSFFYFPSDGGGHLPLRCEEILKKVTIPIAMSKFGQKQLKDIYGMRAEYIPHGCNTSLYYPISDKEKVKSRVPCYMFNGQNFVKTDNILQNKFIIGSVFRNQPRKQPDRLYKAFAKFAKDKPDVMLYLHLDPLDVASPIDTLSLMGRLNILHKVVFTGMTYITGFSTKMLNDIYNSMDCFFLSTTGEGFGLPTLEAMSCGVPPIITDYATTSELLQENGECGLPINIIGTEEISTFELMKERGYNSQQIDEFRSNGTIVGSWNVDRAIMDIDSAVKQLDKLYYDKKLRESLGKTGREKAVKYYDWEVLIPVWNKLLLNLAEE